MSVGAIFGGPNSAARVTFSAAAKYFSISAGDSDSTSPMLIWLLGAFAPSTDAGTIEGNPPTTVEARRPPPAVVMNARRDGLSVMSACIS